MQFDGAIDLHCHYGPDFIRPWRDTRHAVTALEAATEAAAAGHAAIVLKSHDFASPALAYAVQEVVPDVAVFGGITLDYQAGGLNPLAVEHALRLGAKIVWLPTVSSHQDRLNGCGARQGYTGPGLRVVDDDGDLLPVVREILDLVHDHDAILATGHVSADEHHVVAREFARRGKVIVTHAGEELAGPNLDAAQCAELADLGAIVELSVHSCMPSIAGPGKSLAELAAMIQAVGPARCTLASDLGSNDAHPNPVAGLHDHLERLWREGASEQDLRVMVCDNPARLLGLDA